MAYAGTAFSKSDYESGILHVLNANGSVNVTYSTDGGYADKLFETIKKKSLYIENNASKDGYTFSGWSLSSFEMKSIDYFVSIELTAIYS